MPVEKLSRKRTQLCSSGAEVPPDVTRAIGVWWAVCRVTKLINGALWVASPLLLAAIVQWRDFIAFASVCILHFAGCRVLGTCSKMGTYSNGSENRTSHHDDNDDALLLSTSSTHWQVTELPTR